MGIYQVRVTENFQKDMDSVSKWLLERTGSMDASHRFNQKVIGIMSRLERFPKMFKRWEYDDGTKSIFRYFSVNNHLAFYLVMDEENVVLMERIVYGGRDMAQLIEEPHNDMEVDDLLNFDVESVPLDDE